MKYIMLLLLVGYSLISKPLFADDQQAFIQAVADNNKDEVAQYLKKIDNPNQYLQYENQQINALSLAAYKGYKDIIQLLLDPQNGAKEPVRINAENNDKNTALHFAVLGESSDEDLEQSIELLLAHGADPNLQNTELQTPLIITLLGYELAGARILIPHTDVNIRDDGGNTALFYASQHALKDIVQSLIERGAKVKVTNNEGNTPLQIAQEKLNETSQSKEQEEYREIIKLLQAAEKQEIEPAPEPVESVDLVNALEKLSSNLHALRAKL